MLLLSQGHIFLFFHLWSVLLDSQQKQWVGRPQSVNCGSLGLSLKPGYNISPDHLLRIFTKQPSVNVFLSTWFWEHETVNKLRMEWLLECNGHSIENEYMGIWSIDSLSSSSVTTSLSSFRCNDKTEHAKWRTMHWDSNLSKNQTCSWRFSL